MLQVRHRCVSKLSKSKLKVFAHYYQKRAPNYIDLKKVVTLKEDVGLIVNNMQKSVISSCTNQSRTFKI